MLRLTLLCVLGLTACGGQAEDGQGTADGGAGGGGGSFGPPLDPLPECVPGFAPGSAGRHCNWMADTLCYEERKMACACACPRNEPQVTCISGFGGDDTATPVTCQ